MCQQVPTSERSMAFGLGSWASASIARPYFARPYPWLATKRSFLSVGLEIELLLGFPRERVC